MSRTPVLLSAPTYVLGEVDEPYDAVPGFAERAAGYRMAPRPELWGWGRFRRTEHSLAALAIEAGRSTMRAAGLDPSTVDALVLCSTKFPGGAETHGAFVAEITAGLGLPDVAFTGVTLNRCTGLLAAIDIADAFVASGRHRTVLVVTTDRIADESTRLHTFALFSDGAAGCVVAATGHGPAAYEIVACANAQRTSDLDWTHEISAELAKDVTRALLKPAGVELAAVDALAHPNLFIPVVVMKERLAGFAPQQLYLDNVARVGHCFAADPLINLVDRAALGQVSRGGHVMLAASVPGSRYGVLLRACG